MATESSTRWHRHRLESGGLLIITEHISNAAVIPPTPLICMEGKAINDLNASQGPLSVTGANGVKGGFFYFLRFIPVHV